VKRSSRFVYAFLAVVALATSAIALSACGSSSDDSTSSPGKAGTITLLQGTAPDYLDPSQGYTTQSANADWVSYTGLYTYAHANDKPGTQVIPGLAQALPVITNGGKTYSMTLRPNLKYSDGSAVKASDFAYTIQRAIKTNWGGKSFYTGYIVGADKYDTGKSKSISGIKTDDATGKITVNLTSPYGAFLNVMSFPSSGLVPTGTAMKNLSNDPPPGVGPMMIKDVVPNQSYTIAVNPEWAKLKIPNIPASNVNVKVKINSNTQSEATQVLNNSADIFDWADSLPPALIPKIQSQAKDRYEKVDGTSMYYFFLNVKAKPFDNLKARQAVITGLDRRALSRIDAGYLTPDCYFIPKGMVGHPTNPCPYGDPAAAPDLAKAKQLLKESGQMGAKVTVWGQNRSPRKEWIDYYTDTLNKIGFKAKTKLVADANYFPTIGNLDLNPQTGFADWIQDFPNPSDYYLLLDKASIQKVNNQNFGQVADPHIQSELAYLNNQPASDLDKNEARWQQLDEYTAKQGYAAVFGYQADPKFYSTKINFGDTVFHPVYGTDLSGIKLK
jgi:peptide/nickel transport system substrate-binding protein